MTLLEHVYAVKTVLAHGPAPAEFSFSDRLIAHYLEVARAKLVERKIDKYHFISEQTYQDWCVDLALSNFHDCCTGPSLDCKVLRSTIQVPKFLNSRWGNFLKVMDLSGRVLPEIRPTQNRLSQYAIVPLQEGWFMHNNYIFVVNSKVLEKILVNGLFNSPQEIHDLNCPSNNNNCPDFMDEVFPIDSDLVDDMYKITIENLMRSLSIPQDVENNRKDVETANGRQ